MNLLIIVVLILLCLGAAPVWPHAANWGVLIVIILVLLGRI